jgi:DNA ligase D-like protein (predicted ligase)
MLARSAEAPFSSADWIFEVKWDGIRAISYLKEELSIRSRNQKELIDNFPELSELKSMAKDMVLDGEIIVMKDGKADFQTLIKRSQNTNAWDIDHMARKFPATYVVFDILEKEGKKLLDTPLMERKNILENSVGEGKFVVLSLFVEGTGIDYYGAALEKGVEGVMAKKKDSLYEPGKRSNNWLKIKQVKTCDCVVFGYTKGEGNRNETFGSLILGLYDGETPVFISKVGTGFSREIMENLKQILDNYKVEKVTLQGVDSDRDITWLRGGVVCEVGYQSITEDGKLRIPVFRTIRDDKDPLECTIDQIRPALSDYTTKRDFSLTPEPVARVEKSSSKSFVVHEHHARRLHFDLRLEKDGVSKAGQFLKAHLK